jgi:hypothetical protein
MLGLKDEKEKKPGRCRAAYVCLLVIGLAAFAQAAVLAYGIYEGYAYRNWERPLGFIFEPLQWQHWFNLFWFWPIIVLALVMALLLSVPRQSKLPCARPVGRTALLTFLVAPIVSYLSDFVWENQVWRLLAVYLIYGSLVMYLGLRGYLGLRKAV